jgi:putative oxidoreductase
MAIAKIPAIVAHLPTVRGLLPSLVQLLLRFGLAGIFWSSARTKVEGVLTVSENTLYLFAEEYRLPLLSPDIAAHLATYAEHLFPMLLAIGLGTRFAALGLFAMTLVIQLFVYPDAFFSIHLGWMAMAAAIIFYGPGSIAVDERLFGVRKR